MRFGRNEKAKPKNILLALVLLFLVCACSPLDIYILNLAKSPEIQVIDNRLYLLGFFNANSKAIIIEALEKNPAVDTIVFTINEGSLDDQTTLEIGREIRKRGLTTSLRGDSVICSGAVDLFLAGARRLIEPGAMIGVHSWSDGFKDADKLPKSDAQHLPYTQYFNEMLGGDEFYWFSLKAAPAEGMHWMTQSEIENFNFATEMAETSELPHPFGLSLQEKRLAILQE